MRAYRQRKAEEHASVDELRVERRVMKRQLSDALRGRTRAEAALERATARIESLESDLEGSQERLRQTEADLAFARSRIRELVERHDPAPSGTREPGPSRQQRRAKERNERKRKR